MDSNKPHGQGQFVHPRFQAGTARRMLLIILAIVSASCTSIYHRTRSGFPPEAVSEVEPRMAEARHAEAEATAAAEKLLKRLRQPAVDDALLATDFDRLDAAAFELDRRALATRDAAARQGDATSVIAELERMLARAQAWLTYEHANRTADRATQIGQLEALLTR